MARPKKDKAFEAWVKSRSWVSNISDHFMVSGRFPGYIYEGEVYIQTSDDRGYFLLTLKGKTTGSRDLGELERELFKYLNMES